jgi:hypothetical protein
MDVYNGYFIEHFLNIQFPFDNMASDLSTCIYHATIDIIFYITVIMNIASSTFQILNLQFIPLVCIHCLDQ